MLKTGIVGGTLTYGNSFGDFWRFIPGQGGFDEEVLEFLHGPGEEEDHCWGGGCFRGADCGDDFFEVVLRLRLVRFRE